VTRIGPQARLTLEGAEGTPTLTYLPQPGLPDLPPLSLHPLLAAVLSLLDRGHPEAEVAEDLARRLAHPVEPLRELVQDAAWSFRGHLAPTGNGLSAGSSEGSLVDGELEPLLERLLAGLLADGADGRTYRTREVLFQQDRLPFPVVVQWLVTRLCNRGCIYCYQGATPSARATDSSISAQRVRQILQEAARLGASGFYITGGEPLLREDIYDLLIFSLELGMEPKIITKQRIPAEAVERLADAGLRRIALSIDSVDPAVAATMTRVRTYARDILGTVQRLVDRGIEVEARTVLTTENLATLPRTLAELDRLGVRWIRIDRYEPNFERHSDALLPSEDQMAWAGERIEDFRAAGGGLEVTLRDPLQAGAVDDFETDIVVCNNGIAHLLFLPDGKVSRCDKPLPGGEMVVGDLTRQSVFEVWNSPRMLASLKPPRELYRDTLCFDCEQFDLCHQRGRCFYSAALQQGSLYGPHESCPYVHGSSAVLPVVT